MRSQTHRCSTFSTVIFVEHNTRCNTCLPSFFLATVMTGLLYAEALTIRCVFPKDSFLLAVRICLSNLLAVCVCFFFFALVRLLVRGNTHLVLIFIFFGRNYHQEQTRAICCSVKAFLHHILLFHLCGTDTEVVCCIALKVFVLC